MFSLVSDRLGEQVSEQKDARTLDKVKKADKKFGEIADMAFCIVADGMLSKGLTPCFRPRKRT